MLRRPPTRLELKGEDKDEVRTSPHRSIVRRARGVERATDGCEFDRFARAQFERLRRERVNARELGTIGARDSVDGDAVRRAERERERERRIGIAEVREEE